MPSRGLGPLLFLVLSWLLPLALASVLRAALGLPLWVGALGGVMLMAGVTVWAIWRFKPWPTHAPLALLQAISLFVLGWLTWRMLGIPAMGGLVTVGGGDAGNHAALVVEFATRTPDAYQGFTFFHTVVYGLEQLFLLDVFSSFRVAFYLVPGVLAMALVAGLELSAGRLWRSAWAVMAAQVVLLVATAGVWAILLLRLLHYHQADGFYAHLFGLVPLVLMAFAYALPRSPWVRCAALAAFIVLYRFTYGLNLGDLLVTGGVLWLFEGAAFPPRWRRPVQAVGLVLLVAAAYAYWRLLPLARIPGGIVPFMHMRTLTVQGWCLGGLVLVRFLSPRHEPVERRLLDFTLLFAGVNGLVQRVCRWAGLPVEYYLLKYGLHAVVLLLLVAGLVVSLRVGALLQEGRGRVGWRALVPPLLTALGLVAVVAGWSDSFAAYTPGYEERVRGQPPFQVLDALEDPSEVTLVRRVLRESRKRFGGLLSPSWPRLNFTLVELGWLPEEILVPNGHYHVFHEGGVREEPGACVFWEDSPEDDAFYRVVARESPALLERVRQLRARPDKVCRPFAAAWVTNGSRTLCYRCE